MGSSSTCLECKKELVVPKPFPHDQSTSSISGTEIIKFYCVYCGQKLSMSERMSGKMSLCPSCSNTLDVPFEQISAVRGKKEVSNFFCLYCGHKLSAISHWQGSQISCPKCQAEIAIPEI